mgnify:CR=1 FL=1
MRCWVIACDFRGWRLGSRGWGGCLGSACGGVGGGVVVCVRRGVGCGFVFRGGGGMGGARGLGVWTSVRVMVRGVDKCEGKG